MTLRLLSYNIRHGGIGREAQLAAVITARAPDVAVLQEARDPSVIEYLSRETGLSYWGARPGLSLGFISRLRPERAIWHKPRVSRHAFLEIIPEGSGWRIFGVHLSAVHAAWTERRRVFELRALLAAIGREQPGPHVLIGDFNTLAPGELLEVRKLPLRLRSLVWMSGGDVRYRTIKTVLDAGYVDVGPKAHSFPTWDPHVRLDYIFAPGGYVGRVQSPEVVTGEPAREASDHFPLFCEIDVTIAR